MKIFLSAVSRQFKECRDALASDLRAVGAEVVVQEDFQQHGRTLLEKLEQYIASCDRVIALIGDAYGWEPDAGAIPGLPQHSYSQWEYFFAQGERLRKERQPPIDIYVYFASPAFLASHPVDQEAGAKQRQQSFVAEVRRSGKDWNEFGSTNELRALVLRDGFRIRMSAQSRQRTRYLRDMRKSIENILNESIHRARFIDLGIEDKPDSIRTPLLYENPERREPLENLWQAYEKADERLLLLGDPGSGKSTSLYHLALRLVEQAESDPEAPAPFIQNLSLFPLRKKASNSGFQLSGRVWFASHATEQTIGDWLIKQLSERAGISTLDAAKWVDTQRVALLLDGLDEVNDERRIEFAIRLNQTVLAAWPHLPVVICSRTYEYIPIKESEDARLQLRGAAVLQPLAESAILEYVRTARTPALESALNEDAALMQMATSPLMLSLMTLAYGGAVGSEIRLGGSLTERRHGLMKDYVTRMLQRTARKERGKPTDIPAYDVSESEYRYSLSQVHEYLGWLAIRMSVRMRTSVTPSAFFKFLTDTRAPSAYDENFATNIALALLAAVLAAIAIAPLVRREPDYLPISVIVIVLVPILALCGRAMTAMGKTMKIAMNVGGVALAVAFTAIALSQFARSVPTLWPSIGSSITGGVVALVTWGSAATLLIAIVERERGLALGSLGVLSIVYLPVVLGPWRNAVISNVWVILILSRGDPSVLAGTSPMGAVLFVDAVIAIVVLTVVIMINRSGGDFFERLMFTIFAPFLPVLAIRALLAIPDYTLLWTIVLVTGSLTIHSVAFGHRSPRHIVVPATIGAIAAAIFLRQGQVLFLVITWTLLLIVVLSVTSGALARRAGIGYFRAWLGQLGDRIEVTLDRAFLTPVTWSVLCIMRRWPWRRRRFAKFCSASLLLRYSRDFEFTHRRLRDYFALQRVLPRLASESGEKRLEAIETLSFQGDAAVETLMDLIREGPRTIAVASAKAMSRIASLEALAGIREVVRHRDPVVRATMLSQLNHIGREEAIRLIKDALADEDFGVLAAALKMHQDLINSGLRRDNDEQKRLVTEVLSSHSDRRDLVGVLLEAGVQLGSDWTPDWVFKWCVDALDGAQESIANKCMELLAAKHYPTPATSLGPYLESSFSELTRVRALETLVACAPRESSPYLLWALRSGDKALEEPALRHFEKLRAAVDIVATSDVWAELDDVVAGLRQEQQFRWLNVLSRILHRRSDRDTRRGLDQRKGLPPNETPGAP